MVKFVGGAKSGTGGSGGPAPENVDLVDVISCILVHFGDGLHSLHPDLQGLDRFTLHTYRLLSNTNIQRY